MKLRTILLIVVLIIVLAIGKAGHRYYSWVKNLDGAATPLDEVGISLHKLMPSFIQKWGCAQLKAEFEGKTMPPHGCAGPDGRGW